MKVAYTFVIADLLHYGHLRLLETARASADRLVCGVLTDEAVAGFKQPPISSYAERAAVVAALKVVDEVLPQDSQDPTENLKVILARHPGAELVFAHGDQWADIPGKTFLASVGARIVTQPFYEGLSNQTIARKTIEETLPGAAVDTFTPGFTSPSFKVFSKAPPRVILTTKAKTLQALRPLLKKSRVEKTYVFTVGDWRLYPEDVLAGVKASFPDGPVVVRSSRLCEDSLDTARAGHYRSVLDVAPGDREALDRAIEDVIESYTGSAGRACLGGDETSPLDQVLVQSQTRDIVLSGVVFTVELKTNAPYYVVNYDRSGRSDTVTAGLGGHLLRVFRGCPPSRLEPPFRQVLEAVQEIEAIVPGFSLDIEFAVDARGDVVIFQVRPLAANTTSACCDAGQVAKHIRSAERLHGRLSSAEVALSGEAPVFSDMLFWNPAELIGHRPSNLAYSLFNRILMDKAWNRGLTPLGYPDLHPDRLIVRFLYKPYIKVNTAFRALTPAPVPSFLRGKLMRFYLDKLAVDPSLHDKAEFDILFTCWDFDTPARLRELEEHGFTRRERDEFNSCLLGFTRGVLAGYRDIGRALRESAGELDRYNATPLEARRAALGADRDLGQADAMLDTCERLGTVPFCMAARLAFVAGALLRGLERSGVISPLERDILTGSFSTVAADMTADTAAVAAGKMDFEAYREKYGHLRSGTYDIEKKRYGDIITPDTLGPADLHDKHVPVPPELRARIERAVSASPLGTDFDTLLGFISEFTRAREHIKFVYTRTLSDVLELFRQAGAMLGLGPADVSLLECRTALSLFGLKPMVLDRTLETARRDLASWRGVVLPPLVFGRKDFRVQRITASRPNFITTRSVRGGTAVLNGNEGNGADRELAGKIVFVENADPGYHWLFSRNILGLVTKYGGAASHMAICCAEMDIPAAIGCGDLYDRLAGCPGVELDCSNHVLRRTGAP